MIVHGIVDAVEPAGPADEGYSQPPPGSRWIAIDIETVNDSDDLVSVPLSTAELRTTDGRSAYGQSFGRGDMPEPGWQVPADASSRGWIGYEISVGVEPDTMLAMRRQGELGPPAVIDL
ncbi:MAG: hypothetical protein H0U83_05440 [Sphingomonas sp.]|nr:hypothetical protein [Sphingomonas sp.]